MTKSGTYGGPTPERECATLRHHRSAFVAHAPHTWSSAFGGRYKCPGYESDHDGTTEVPNFRRSLGMMEDYIKYAREALDDEHEGNFKYYVRQVTELAAALHRDVQEM